MKKRKFVRCGPIKLYGDGYGEWASPDERILLCYFDDGRWCAWIDGAPIVYDCFVGAEHPARAARKLGEFIGAAQELLERPVGRIDLGEARNACATSSPPDLKVNGTRPEPAKSPCAEHCEQPGGPCLERATRIEELRYEVATLTGLVRALRCPEKDCVLPRRHSGSCGVIGDGNVVSEFTDTRPYRVEVRFVAPASPPPEPRPAGYIETFPVENVEFLDVVARSEDAAMSIARSRITMKHPGFIVTSLRVVDQPRISLPPATTAAPEEIGTGEHDA